MSKRLLALLLLATAGFCPGTPDRLPSPAHGGHAIESRISLTTSSWSVAHNGDPQPETWRILLDDPKAGGGVREVEVSNGKIISERTPLRSAVRGFVGCDDRHREAESRLERRLSPWRSRRRKNRTSRSRPRTTTLRVDERGNPIWIVGVAKDRGGEPAGKHLHRRQSRQHHADRGLLQRRRSDRSCRCASRRSQDRKTRMMDDGGDQNAVKRSIKHAFRQAGGRREAHFLQGPPILRVDFFSDDQNLK